MISQRDIEIMQIEAQAQVEAIMLQYQLMKIGRRREYTEQTQELPELEEIDGEKEIHSKVG